MKEYKCLHLLQGFILTFLFLCTAVVFTLNFRPLYIHNIRNMNITDKTGMTEEAILEQYDVLIAYNRMNGPDVLSFPALPSSETGLLHFEEVKVIFLFFQWGIPIGAVVSVVGILFFWKRKQNRYLKHTALISLLGPIVLGLLAVLFWERFFVIFHEIFFRNDYWLFDADTDPIIRLLPDTYFLHCAIMIVALVMLGGGISASIHFVSKNIAKRKGI